MSASNSNSNTNRDQHRYNRELLLLEYLGLIRDQITQHSNIIRSYSRTIETSSNNLTNLLERYLASSLQPTTEQTRPFVFSSNRPVVRNSIYSSRSVNQSPLANSTTTANPWSRQRIQRNTRRPRNLARQSTRNPGRQNIINQILQTTLYTPTTRVPASIQDISRNTSIHSWNELSETTNQSLCPITQENFQPDDSVIRIDNCGHLFLEEALTTYFLEFDHRCPICRYNISSNINSPSTNYDGSYNIPTFNIPPLLPSSLSTTTNSINQSTATTTNQTQPPRNLTRTLGGIFDISLNNNFPNSTNMPPTINFDFNSANFNDAVSQLSNAMLSSLSGAMNNPDNSGNTIRADYSLFVPQPPHNSNTRDNATSTEDEDQQLKHKIEV